ncbi:MAG: type II toxin-antitoxin system RelE/ParE family toxin [Paraglaciecola sp.]|nr:type II toxin-antitoxin system RelE/ParE family toxin [Paraglaciecola sp.]NCT49237.1 type II toxin-antitoxin system RelE/ParE family toxin [Paraglaciecola sp.]
MSEHSLFKSSVNDLAQIKAYYLEQGVPHIGTYFVSVIAGHVETLSKHLDMGLKVPECNDGLILELIHVSFRVVYLPEGTSIKVIRLWRAERILHLPK